MDFTPHLSRVRDNHLNIQDLLDGTSTVVCLGNRASLVFFIAGFQRPELLKGAATGAAAGWTLIQAHRPGFVLVSDSLEDGDGTDLVTTIKRELPATRILLLVTRERRRRGLRAVIEAGCDGILLESHMGLGGGLAAIHTVCRGGLYLDRSLRNLLHAGGDDDGPSLRESLSPRETEVLQRAVCGQNNAEIAAHLFISEDTVKTHVRHVLQKLQARGRTHAAVLGLQRGLVDWPESSDSR